MRNSTIMNTPAQAAALAQPMAWTLPDMGSRVWHEEYPDYARRMKAMANRCRDWRAFFGC